MLKVATLQPRERVNESGPDIRAQLEEQLKARSSGGSGQTLGKGGSNKSSDGDLTRGGANNGGNGIPRVASRGTPLSPAQIAIVREQEEEVATTPVRGSPAHLERMRVRQLQQEAADEKLQKASPTSSASSRWGRTLAPFSAGT